MEQWFVGKRLFITGASSGIGAATAVAFAEHGARVALAARRSDRLEDVARIITEKGGEALVAPCDVRDRSSLDAAVAQMVEVFGGVDIAIANAGYAVAGPFHRLTTQDYRRQFDTNVFGVLDTIYAVLPHLIESKGHLALVSSLLGRMGSPLKAPYAASKFALCGMAECMRYDLARKNVSVTCIEPGVITTEIGGVDNFGVLHPDRKFPSSPKDQWIAVSPEKAAQEIVWSIHVKKFEAIITGHARWMLWFNRHAPGLTYLFMRFLAQRGGK